MKKSPDDWTTADEIEYVRNLGTHWDVQDGRRGKGRGNPNPDRLKLLLSYLKGMETRTEWGPLDPKKIRQACQSEIADECMRRPIPEKALWVPCDGHGLIGARSYARPSRRTRIGRTPEDSE